MRYFSQVAAYLAVPTLIIGIALLIFAAKGFARKDLS
jgi:hypothetical protein